MSAVGKGVHILWLCSPLAPSLLTLGAAFSKGPKPRWQVGFQKELGRQALLCRLLSVSQLGCTVESRDALNYPIPDCSSHWLPAAGSRLGLDIRIY